jgi:single-strand DNA-binding protein
MVGLNKVMLMGRLGAPPELRTAPDKPAVANMRVATTEVWKDKGNGERREATEWHTVVAFGTQAESCAKYLDKGRLVYVEGRLVTRSWTDGEGKTRYRTEVRAQSIRYLDPPSRGGPGPQDGTRNPRPGNGAVPNDDGVPF